jgi:hypothetical protein
VCAVDPPRETPNCSPVANVRPVDEHSPSAGKTEVSMAEGMLGGIPGDDEEKPKVESPEALATAEAHIIRF